MGTDTPKHRVITSETGDGSAASSDLESAAWFFPLVSRLLPATQKRRPVWGRIYLVKDIWKVARVLEGKRRLTRTSNIVHPCITDIFNIVYVSIANIYITLPIAPFLNYTIRNFQTRTIAQSSK